MKAGVIIIGLSICLITVSLSNMLIYHEFQISEITLILGIIFAGIAYAKLPNSEIPNINTKAVNKNIQTLNYTLWGKKEKTEPSAKITPEQYWQISVQEGCRDIRDTWGVCYCCYGGKRGYCTFERCPRRVK